MATLSFVWLDSQQYGMMVESGDFGDHCSIFCGGKHNIPTRYWDESIRGYAKVDKKARHIILAISPCTPRDQCFIPTRVSNWFTSRYRNFTIEHTGVRFGYSFNTQTSSAPTRVLP